MQVVLAAMDEQWPPGISLVFNIGTGRGITNGAVASVVQSVLQERGYRLNVNFDNPLESGESMYTVIDVESTSKQFGIPQPQDDEVVTAIREATLHHLEAN